MFDTHITPLTLIAALYHGRQIINPDSVIACLDIKAVKNTEEGYNELLHGPDAVERFTCLLLNYFRSPGHPSASQHDLGLSDQEMNSRRHDETLRARNFVLSLTASSCLPRSGSHLSVCIVNYFIPQ